MTTFRTYHPRHRRDDYDHEYGRDVHHDPHDYLRPVVVIHVQSVVDVRIVLIVGDGRVVVHDTQRSQYSHESVSNLHHRYHYENVNGNEHDYVPGRYRSDPYKYHHPHHHLRQPRHSVHGEWECVCEWEWS